MAEVVSYTAQKILEMVGGIDDVTARQQGIDGLIAQLQILVQSNDALQNDFNSNILPQLRDQVSANDAAVRDVVDNVVPGLSQTVDQHAATLDDMNRVTIPSLSEQMANQIQNAIDRPMVYVQPDEPTNPDVDDRDLVYGDTWFDSDDNNRQRIWDGLAWSTFEIDIPDLSITVQKFRTGTHMIY